MDYSKLSKAELKERRSQLKRQAERQFNRFEKLSSEERYLLKYHPYQMFKEQTHKSKSGQRAFKFSAKDSRNKMLEDVVMLENMLNKETSTVTGARRVYKKQVRNKAKEIREEQKKAAERARAKGETAPKVEKQSDIEKKLSTQKFYKFLHSSTFKEIQKINKQASEEAIEFYVKHANKGNKKVLEALDKFLSTDTPFTKEALDENPFI